jgi:hypothetical protein
MTRHTVGGIAGEFIVVPWEPIPKRQGLFARLALSSVGVAIGVLAFSGVIHTISLVCWILP